MSNSIIVILGVKLSALTSRNRFIALTSRLATIGIMLGVATLITVLAVMRGFENEIRHSLIKQFDHLQVFAFNEYYPKVLYDEVSQLPHVVSVTGYAKTYGLIKTLRQYIPVMLLTFEKPVPMMGLPDLNEEGIYLSEDDSFYFEEGDEVNLILPQVGQLKPKVVSPMYLGEYDPSQLTHRGFMTGLVSFSTFR